MSTAKILHPSSPFLVRPAAPATSVEAAKSRLLRAWIFSGIFFMALPGTLLGFSNLMAISAHHGSSFLPAAWMEGHGHAQLFGWIGSFVLGIGFYSQPSRGSRVPQLTFLLWTSGVALRWFANIYSWHWRLLVPFSAALELAAFTLFLIAASHHKAPAESSTEPRRGSQMWMIAVLLGSLSLGAALLFNLVECLRLALHGASAAFPHALDQRYLLLLGWGFLVPTVWGFSARWLPSFLSLPQPRTRMLSAALLLDLCGLALGLAGFFPAATVALFIASLTIFVALRLTARPSAPPKILGIHRAFAPAIRASYAWLVVAASMSLWAAMADQHGGIWGASRHALTVGFAATMVFAVGPRILPHFAGVARLFSPRLMGFSLLAIQLGCTLRVLSEPLAYEGFLPFAWRVLPISGAIELSAVLAFALNLSLTFLCAAPLARRAQN